MDRNRSEGWQYAKLSGHKKEEKVNKLFYKASFRFKFESTLHIPPIKSHSFGGLKEKNVESILGDTTKSKTDLSLMTINSEIINVSIKKSLSGQVYQIGVERFLEGLNKIFGVKVSEEEKKVIKLYFDGDDTETDKILKEVEKSKEIKNIKGITAYMKKRHRLTALALDVYMPGSSIVLINWFKKNIKKIAKFCFAFGLAKDKKDWANYVWYINLVEGEDRTIKDYIFKIENIYSRMSKKEIYYGDKFGGVESIRKCKFS